MLVIAMIETLEGVDNALEIATVPGVDVSDPGQRGSGELLGIRSGQPRVPRYAGPRAQRDMIAISACLVPARRAAAVDPVSALRVE
jgi:hypothetical protein